MGSLFKDFGYAMRQVVHKPGLTVAIVLTLGIGIGANTTVFSFVNSVFLRPLPYPQPDQLVQLWSIRPSSGTDGGMSAADFQDCVEQNRCFARLAAYEFERMNIGAGEAARRIVAIRTTEDFLRSLGTQPVQGRSFTSEEYGAGGMSTAIVTWAAWQRHWGGRSNIVGSVVMLDGQPYTVIGVLPPAFQIRFPFCGQGHAALAEAEVYLPLSLQSHTSNRGARSLLTLARLKTGVALEQARAELKTIASRLQQEYPESNKGWEFMVLPLHELKASAGVAAPLFLGPVILVLMIGCVNVINMLLARAVGRQKEIAIRLALGAGRARLGRQLLVESVCLALMGGALGILFAAGACALVQHLFQNSLLFPLPSIRLDAVVLTFTFGITVLTGVAIGVLPTFHGLRTSISELLQREAATVSGARKSRGLGQVLVIAEIASALALLTATGLLLRSLVRTWNVDLGFRTKDVLCMNVALPAAAYKEPDRQKAFFEQLQLRVRSHPGITSAALVSSLPTSGRGTIGLRIPGNVVFNQRGEDLHAGFTVASPDYFTSIGVPLVAGRDFTQADSSVGTRAVVINSTMASKYWPAENPVGAMLEVGGKPATVVGVVGDLRRPHMAGVFEPQPEIFGPLQQWPGTQMILVMKSALAEQAPMVSGLRRELSALEPYVVVSDIQTLDDAVSRSTSTGRVVMVMMMFFAGSALLLAAIGLYGLMSYTLSRRTQEIGIRMALGAVPRQVLKMLVFEGSRLLFWGLALGLLLSAGVGKVLANKLYRVSAFDAPVCLCVGIVLAITMLAACYIPARRAARGDPLAALRYE